MASLEKRPLEHSEHDADRSLSDVENPTGQDAQPSRDVTADPPLATAASTAASVIASSASASRKNPLSQDLQTWTPASVVYSPTPQLTQEEDPKDCAYLPALHSRQLLLYSDSATLCDPLNMPGRHCTQLPRPGVDAACPPLHNVHAAALTNAVA